MEELKIQTTPVLVKQSASYKITIPDNVEQKIRYLCAKIPNTEWSGILFYKVNGTFEDLDLEIVCQDIYLMNIGSSTFTEFEMSPEVIGYMFEHQELLDCQVSIIHSHNRMEAFFSGTDLETLRKEGTDRNNFVSLIVNNAGEYKAAITRKAYVDRNIEESYKYEFFDKGSKEYKSTHKCDAVEIQYFDLIINKESNSPIFTDMENRINELNKKEKSSFPMRSLNSLGTINNLHIPSLFDDADIIESKDNDSDIFVDEDIVKRTAIHLVTASVLVNPDKIDINKWINGMEGLYKSKFEDLQDFKNFAETYCDYLLFKIPDFIESENIIDDDIITIYAEAIANYLEKFESNPYLEIYINCLKGYIER